MSINLQLVFLLLNKSNESVSIDYSFIIVEIQFQVCSGRKNRNHTSYFSHSHAVTRCFFLILLLRYFQHHTHNSTPSILSYLIFMFYYFFLFLFFFSLSLFCLFIFYIYIRVNIALRFLQGRGVPPPGIRTKEVIHLALI